MNLLARLLAGLVLLVSCTAGALLLTSGPATASCAEPSADHLETSDVVFSGVVSGLRESGGDRITTVRVDRVFKGDVTRRVDVASPADEGDYSMTAVEGDPLIVFGQLDDGEVSSSLCLSVIGPDEYYYEPILAELGEGAAPAPGYTKAESRTFGLTHDQFAAGRAIIGAVGLIAVGFLAFRAWRTRRRTP